MFLVAAFLLFWPVLSFSPFSDDHSALWNSGVRDIPWRTGFMRPLSDRTFRLGYLLFGKDASLHHAFNVAIHGLNTFLVFLLCRRWTDRRGGLYAAFLFLAYPFHQESIVWLVGRESSLGASAVLAGLIVAGSSATSRVRCAWMTVCMLLGTLCYESALLLLPLSLVITRSGLFPSWPPWRAIMAWMAPVAAAYLMLRLHANGAGSSGYMQGLLPAAPAEWAMNIPKAFGRLVLPPAPEASVQVVRAAVLVLVMLALLLRHGLAARSLHAPSLLLISLIVVSGSVAATAGVSTVTSESDRYLYLPSAFLCSLIGMVLSRLHAPFTRWTMLIALLVPAIWQTKVNHANWRQASIITGQCISALPEPGEQGRLWVQDLPQDTAGAFIFRNGFNEAMELAGRSSADIVVVPPGLTRAQVEAVGLVFRGVFLVPAPGDRWCQWQDGGYVLDTLRSVR